MSENLQENPFAALFGTVQDAKQFRQKLENSSEIISGQEKSQLKEVEISQLEKLLLVSTRDSVPNFTYIYIDDTPPLDCESLDIILFERLLLTDVASQIRNAKEKPKLKDEKLEVVGRAEVVSYLFDVYERCWNSKDFQPEILRRVQSSVVTNLATALEQPEIFNGQQPDKQLGNLILNQMHNSPCLSHMVIKLLENANKEGGIPFRPLFEKILEDAKKKLESCTLMGIEWSLLNLIDFYTSSPILAPLLLDQPKSGQPGRLFQSTLLGSLLSISCLPKAGRPQKSDYFDKPSSQGAQAHKAMEYSIGVAQKALNSRVYTIFITLLKCSPVVKDLLLKWIEACLEANSGRAGLWHIQGDQLRSMSFVSDGFMANLGAVLLKIASPFRDIVNNEIKNYKVLKVDPLYCSPAVARRKDQIRGVYSGDLPKQTPLVPRCEDPDFCAKREAQLPSNFSFIMTCFFHTHRSLHLGLQVIHQKMFKMSQELGRLQHEFQEVSAQGSPATEMMREHLEAKTSVFLSYKAVAFETSLVDEMLEFLASTSLWLLQVALSSDDDVRSPLSPQEVSLSQLSPDDAPPSAHSRLQDVPELIVENLVEALIAIRRYSPDALSLSGDPLLPFFMSFIASFMGSPRWMNNPHLRAHLAECLETLTPKDGDSSAGGLVGGARDRLFAQHPLADHLATAIIHVFVSIEMTGQSVAFEEKFNYRRPMYEVMKYLWDLPQHRKQFVRLANYALAHMESAKPPLFLRFVNLLMNDAIFLLDEGLSYMSQIRESQTQRDAGDWSRLSTEQRGERERSTNQMSLLARFHNMLGSRTIQKLLRLSKEIPTMFTHGTLIDRMAAMLNHFLTHLVGPKQGNLKVRDMEKYEFRPSEIVSDICTIYINLSKEPEFCVAVSSDDRSYSPELFTQACGVLTKIHQYQLRQELESFSEEVKIASQKRTENEDLASSAPEEFIDPILSHLMNDPVLLPSSQMIVDRQTIARHLLSDQTDPFNRQPLTMEEIINQDELKTRIQEWLAEQKAKWASRKA